MKTLAEQHLKHPIEQSHDHHTNNHDNNHHHTTQTTRVLATNESEAIKLVHNKMKTHIEYERQKKQQQQQEEEDEENENNLNNKVIINNNRKQSNNNIIINYRKNNSEANTTFKQEQQKVTRSKILQRDQNFDLDDDNNKENNDNKQLEEMFSATVKANVNDDDVGVDVDHESKNFKLNRRIIKEREDFSVEKTQKQVSGVSGKEEDERVADIGDVENNGKQKEKLAEGTTAPATTTPSTTTTTTRPEIGPMKKVSLDCLFYLIRGVISTYDLISWPFYYIQQGVAKRRREVDFVRSKKFDPNDPDSPWRQINIAPFQVELEEKINSYKTYDEMMEQSFISNSKDTCFAYRQIIEEQWIKRPESGDKLIRQVRLSEYKWCTFEQFNQQIDAARKGFLRDGVRAGQKVILFADTRAEWQIVSQALVRLGAIVCTMYSTLGIDGIVHTCNETKASLVVTQRDKVERLLKLHDKISGVKKVVYFDTSLHLPSELGGNEQDDEHNKQLLAKPARFQNQLEARVECVSFVKLLKLGLNEPTANEHFIEEENKTILKNRTKESLAVIMYTSGSTGIPKGVLISHGNIMATVKSFSYVTKDFVHNPKQHVCTAYLPLAHIFEFCIESTMLYHGVKYGFATPHTLTDKSPGLVPGERGDLGILRPTVMIIVPLILDRVVQGVKQALKADSYFKEQFVSYLIEYKSYWQKRQYDTPLVDKIVCSKIAQALGGRAKFVICGSAPLSSQTQTFVRSALNLKLPQGFGTTETCAATACQLFDDQSTLNVGLPVAGAQIKLEPWIEGNYRPDDRPNPRGEIVVGGEMIAQGYFNLKEQTEEAFYVDSNGIRWYRTGDIGEFLPNGQLKIIDRKKDLVKLQNGEYISLGRVESTLKSNPYTDNFCVYANSNHNYIVALGPANELAIRQLAQNIVDEQDKLSKNSPVASLNKRIATSTATSAQNSNQREECENLLFDSRNDELALFELREILQTYQNDCLNNNETATTTKPLEPQVNERLAQLCSNKLIVDHVLKHICNIAIERNLLRLEIPKKLLLIPEEWTEDKNLVTAALKIRRNYIYKRYEHELDQLYATNT